MHDIDKKAFGAFVASLRKEKGMTQKELAEKLYLSDKAISKWETGTSIPDTAILMPLAEHLGITVTELLMHQRMSPDTSMDAVQVDDVVKTALRIEDKPLRAYRVRSRWPLRYALCLAAGIAGILLCHVCDTCSPELLSCIAIAGIIGAYFVFVVRLRLPAYYDQYPIDIYTDGPVRLHMFGMRLSNANWPHILRAARLWCCVLLVALPALHLLMGLLAPGFWSKVSLYVSLALTLGGLFAPLYIASRKRSA